MVQRRYLRKAGAVSAAQSHLPPQLAMWATVLCALLVTLGAVVTRAQAPGTAAAAAALADMTTVNVTTGEELQAALFAGASLFLSQRRGLIRNKRA